ncbi:MAG: hypothetical protein J6X33_02300 [Clostridiales bacterium]|nr:hypothetical protein [Clostridiales bacterium]
MKKYIKEYMATVDSFIADELKGASEDQIKDFLSEFDRKLSWFCHERLIHLLVTLAFAMFMLFEIYAAMTQLNLFSAVMSVILLCLTVAYVFHYYFLENSVQKMYTMRDKIDGELKSRRKGSEG